MAKTLNTVTVNKITKAHYDQLVAAGTITPAMIQNQVWLFTDDEYVSADDKTNWNNKLDGLVILSYGSSTWADFIDAYTKNKIVYCRASSNSNPATGSQTRLAFMAYVNNAANPTEVEFQYYRSVNAHSATQQGDQVYVYKINSSNRWSVITREASSKIVAGDNMTSSYSNGVLTLNATGSDKTFVYNQTDTASDTWVIEHNLDKYPSVTVVDSAGTVVEGDVKYDSLNQVTITFSGGFKGKATLN